jgi:hypothetical protein
MKVFQEILRQASPRITKELYQQADQTQKCGALSCAHDKRGPAALHFCHTMNHLPRRHMVQDHRGRVAVGDSLGDRKEVFSLAYKQFRKASVHGKRCHTLSNFEPGDPSANCINDAGDLVTGTNGIFGA